MRDRADSILGIGSLKEIDTLQELHDPAKYLRAGVAPAASAAKANCLVYRDRSENVIGGQETRLAVTNNIADQGFIRFLKLGRD